MPPRYTRNMLIQSLDFLVTALVGTPFSQTHTSISEGTWANLKPHIVVLRLIDSSFRSSYIVWTRPSPMGYQNVCLVSLVRSGKSFSLLTFEFLKVLIRYVARSSPSRKPPTSVLCSSRSFHCYSSFALSSPSGGCTPHFGQLLWAS